MSYLAICLLLIFFVFMLSEFGNRLQARNAGPWLLMAIFICVAGWQPQALRSIADLFGIELISNFVLAALVMFLFLQVYDLSADLTTCNRKLRQVIAKTAAQSFPSHHWEEPIGNSGPPKALVVLPCFNEEKSLPEIIGLVRSLPASTQSFGINYCFVDDGSSDATLQILATQCPENFVAHTANIGVSGVLLTGFQIMRRDNYDYLVQCDSDGQHPVELIPELLNQAASSNTDLLIGSRFLLTKAAKTEFRNSAKERGTTPLRLLGIAFIRLALRMFRHGEKVTDPTSGFRVYSRKACDLLIHRTPDEYPEPESIAILSDFRANIKEIPVQMNSRTTGTSSLNGLKSLRYMLKVSAALLGLKMRAMLCLRRDQALHNATRGLFQGHYKQG